MAAWRNSLTQILSKYSMFPTSAEPAHDPCRRINCLEPYVSRSTVQDLHMCFHSLLKFLFLHYLRYFTPHKIDTIHEYTVLIVSNWNQTKNLVFYGWTNRLLHECGCIFERAYIESNQFHFGSQGYERKKQISALRYTKWNKSNQIS